MPPKTTKAKSASDVWQAAHLQLIFFPVESPRDIKQDWFRDLTGAAPEESVTKAYEWAAVGPCGNHRLNLSIDLARVAFTIIPKSDADKFEAFANLGETPTNAIKSFLSLMDKWIAANQYPIKRIGFAGRFTQRAKSKNAGYGTLKKYLPTIKLDSSSTDLLFRINRPRALKSGPRGVFLNRMSTWTLTMFVRMAQTISPGAQTKSAKSDEEYASTLDFDFNTPAEYEQALPQAKLKKIVREMADAVLEVAAKGDVR